jgi:hypothetical protein
VTTHAACSFLRSRGIRVTGWAGRLAAHLGGRRLIPAVALQRHAELRSPPQWRPRWLTAPRAPPA